MAREELKWQNIDADDLPAPVKKSFDAMVEAEATFKADLEKLLKNEGHMPEDKFLVMSRKGKRLFTAAAGSPTRPGFWSRLWSAPRAVCGSWTKTLSVVPQLVHMNATRPGPPPNGAISATLDIGCRHRLQALCATTFIVLPLEVGPSLTTHLNK